jgi:serine/threonine-protein kinase
MLAGRLPFEGESAVAVATMHVNQPPVPPDEVDPEVPPGAADIVLRALEKDPTGRYPSAGAFSEALTNWRTGGIPPKGMTTQAIPPVPPSQSTRAPRPQRTDRAVTMPLETPAARPSADRDVPSRYPDSLDFDDTPEDLAAPLTVSNRRRSGNGTLWAGFFVVAALAVIIWIGGRMASGDGNDDPTPVVPTPTSVQNPQGSGAATETPSTTTVPNLVGLGQQAASTVARSNGLRIEIIERRADEEADTGIVLEQFPADGEHVDAGTSIQVVLSAGSRRVDISSLNLGGLPVEQVTALLVEAGLNPIVTEAGSAEIGRGNVIRTDPPDQADPASDVTVYVSIGDQVYVDPSLQGEPIDTVVQSLTDAGLIVINRNAVSGAQLDDAGLDREAFGIEDGDVVGIQENGAAFGVWLPRGTEVSLNYYDASLESGN